MRMKLTQRNGQANQMNCCQLLTVLLLLVFQPWSSFAQILINPNAEGGFELGPTFGDNGWIVTNGNATNKWFTGTVPAGFNNRSAYISNDGGTSWAYSTGFGAQSVVHFWRDVTFPAGVMNFTLSFTFEGDGESTGPPAYDELLVGWAPTYYTPVGSATNLFTDVLPSPVTNVARVNDKTTVQTITVNIPGGSALGNCDAPVTRRLIFTWKNDGSVGDQPPAAVDNIRLEATPPVTITMNDPADRCTDGTDMAFSATPIPAGGATGTFSVSPATGVLINNNGTGTVNLDVSASKPGVYNVYYLYDINGCHFEDFRQVEVFKTPQANLKPTLVDCNIVGAEIDLSVMFDVNNSTGGNFSVVGMPTATLNDSLLTIPTGGGCFNIRYEQDNNPHACTQAPYFDQANLLVTIKPNPSFTITGASSPVCQDGGTVAVTIVPNVTSNTQTVTINGNPGIVGVNNLPAPDSTGSTVYHICLTETNPAPAACDTLPGAGYAPCAITVCKTIIVYNDGFQCGANAPFPSECPPDLEATDVCEVETVPSLNLSCSFFELEGPDLIDATLTPQNAVITCEDEEVCLEWEGTLPGVLGDIAAGGPTLSQLNSATAAICYVITYEFCIPIPFVPDPCFDPIPLGDWEDYCDKTIGQTIFGILGDLLGGDGGGGTIVADTDGDGNFDFAAYDYTFPAQSDDANEEPACVPNNVTIPGRTITVRNVVSWPFAPEGVCGVVTSQEINLLELLPIGAIPIVGVIVEDLLAAASCNVNLVFSDEETVEIPVINNTPPEFANCNTSGYVFSEDLACNTEANWSIPVAYDGCYGGLLPYRGRTDQTDTTFFSGTPTPDEVTIDGSGVYQTDGPVPGSELAPGTYTVTYTAYSCSGISSTCSFEVIVTTGDPVLECPANMTVKTDVDQCQAVVMGLSVIQGQGCSTVINYNVDYPVVPGFVDTHTSTAYTAVGTHNDPSGLVFPIGETTITDTMIVDINGDGNFSGLNEKQICSFTVTVQDAQKPVALCIDREVKLDNTGGVTVWAKDPNNGKPFIDGGSTDNCDPNPLIEVARPGGTYGPSVAFNCEDEGSNFVNLRVRDISGNERTCLAHIQVKDFFDGINYAFNLPELCLEANNPQQFDFSNYLNITLPNGTNLNHHQVAGSSYLGDAVGAFGITAFLPDAHSPSLDPGSITSDGVYTPGTGSGFITVSYVLVLPGFTIPPNGNIALAGCFEIIHATFELRQPLTMGSPECMCFDGNERIVDLGVVSGGLEPYRIQYSGVRLDVNGDGISDDADGIYTYDAAHGHDITDLMQDLGELRVVYTQPVWSFTIVDARGCEIFRSGSCDNDDLTEGPNIPCTKPQVELFTEPYLCESQYTWQHSIPTDNCAVTLYDYRIYNPDGTVDGPHNLNALINLAPGAPLPSLLTAVYEFQLGISTVTYYAEDAQGNLTTCSFTVQVKDDDPPHFINCPYPDVVMSAETFHCDAYVNYALPLATDNCDIPLVHQIDNSGLSTGERFPVGLTVLYYEAVDLAGNKDTCRIKVIVNDYWQTPALTCPADVVKNNDPWLCSAVVNNIAPIFSSPCQNNLAVTYSVYSDAALTQRKSCGVWDASGDVFDKGMSWVKYTVQNQPLLLITEVNQSGGVDKLEITNLGPADLDLTCLMVSRTSTNPLATENLEPVSQLPSLAPSILAVGGVRVFDFTFNGAANMPACYTISFAGVTLDEVAVNGSAPCGNFSGTLAGGDVIRTCEDDSNKAIDWELAQPCGPASIGLLNPGLEVMPDNGTQTSLQSIPPNRVSCNFKITIKDVEDPFCGKLDGVTTYNGPGITGINAASCNRSTITVPNTSCIIGDIVFSLTGTATPANSKITLISPYGTRVLITELPADTLPALFAQKAAGIWTLDVVPNAGQTPTVTGWSLKITCIDTFDLADQIVNNDPGKCGANFTWKHPYFVDNCFEGTISVAYTTSNADCVPTGGLLLGKGGYVTTQYFCVGTTTVTYTLVDAAGNIEMCSFDVTVKDVEKPVVLCPGDIFIHLNGGECGRFVSYNPTFTSDNCAVVDTIMTPPSGSWFPIGDSIVTITVYDAAGNSKSCTFVVHIIEHVPTTFSMICNDLEHVSMDESCIYVLNADAALEGDDYHCYDDYVIKVKNAQGQFVPNSFNASQIGLIFTVTVIDPETGNSCWTQLKIEDKLKPALTCPANITIACSESTAEAHTGVLGITDCSNYNKVIDDNYTDFGECGNPRGQIVRTWIVTDIWGNQSTCSQTITIKPFNLVDVVFPADIIVDCESAYLNPAAVQPDHTGRPSINGAPIGTGGYCSASIGYTDVRLEICAGSYEIYRTWLVANTCLAPGPNNPVSQVQRIRVKDFGGPQFACPPAVTVSTDPFNCCATAALPNMIVSEGCSQITNLEAKVTGTNPANGNIVTFTVPGHLGNFPGNNYWNPDTLAIFPYTQCLPIGVFNVQYSAADQCGNISKCNFELVVADLIPPAVACTQVTQVALGGNGQIIVPASVLDQGTTDNCCLDHFAVRRMVESPCDQDTLEEVFAPSVLFCCTDINDTITVVFRAYDCHDNYNDCMVQVLVEDKIKPICTSPANVTVSCENFDPSLWVYGTATATDNCCIDTITTTNSYTLFDTVCNRGTITRTFRAFDCAGQSSQCTQRVLVNYEQDYFVKFPNDVIVTVCDGTGNYGTPTFFGEDCELLATSYTDEIFTVVPDACFKIERSWKVINWCTFNPNAGCINVPNPTPNATSNHPSNLPGPIVSAAGTIAPWNPTVVKINSTDPQATNYSTFYDPNANCYIYKQIIKVIDTQDPVVTCPNSPTEFCDVTPNHVELWNESYWWDNTIQSHNLCEGPSDLTITATDSCSGANINIEYLLFLDLDGNGSMETVISSTNLPAWNTVNFNNAANPNFGGGTPQQFDERGVNLTQKYGFTIQETTTGISKTAAVRWNTQQAQGTYVVPELPYGTHKIKWIISDGCGNETVCEYTFVVKDCKKPTVVCLNGLSVNIMPTQMIQLWASDFLQYVDDNCTPANQVKVGIVKSSETTGVFPVDANGNPITSVTFTCAELGTQAVQLWAIDAAGNADFCETYVIVQDNGGFCTPGDKVTVAGALKTTAGNGLEDATIEIQGTTLAATQFTQVDYSDQQGNYQFPSAVPVNSNITVTPIEDENHINGVSTFDLVLISKHILGLEPLTSPYQMIAADANRSGSITTFDIVELRKLILGVYTELPNNTSWRFVDNTFAFPNVANPFQSAFPENKTVASIAASEVTDDFVAIKVGDINGNAIANNLMSAEDRAVASLIFDVQDRKVKAGETFELTFKAAQRVQGYQFTLNFEGLEVLEILPGADMKTDNFAVFAAEKSMTTSFDAPITATIPAEFTVRFRALQSGSLSKLLSVSSRITRAEAYSFLPVGEGQGGAQRMDVAFRFNGENGATVTGVGFELYQNQPNPVVNYTTIGFHLPQATTATLSIYDEAGKLIHTQKGDFAKGYNQIAIDKALISTTGLMYYKLETSTDSATKKMIQTK